MVSESDPPVCPYPGQNPVSIDALDGP